MGVGYFQLTVTSEQDKYLVGNPQFTYFKSVHKRHTNFAIENRILNFVGETTLKSNSNFGKKYYAKVPKIGDLLHRMYIVFELDSDGNLESIEKELSLTAYSLIDNVSISIGDQVIDKHTGDWLHIFSELFGKGNYSLCDMINTHLNTKGLGGNSMPELQYRNGLVYVPLQFWFNRHIGQSLPLLALQHSDVKIDLQLNKRSIISNVNQYNKTKVNQIYLLGEFIHLDKNERNLFASNKHEYLIEQIQINDRINVPFKREMNDSDYEQYIHKFELPFNHPVKELIWVLQDSNSEKNISGSKYKDSWDSANIKDFSRTNTGNNIYNYWRNLDWENQADQLVSGTISLNGTEIFEPQSSHYFRSVQKFQHHSDFGYDNLDYEKDTLHYANADLSKGSCIYNYSFALHPESNDPSGSLNFSKLDKAELRLRVRRDLHNNSKNSGFNLKSKILKIFAFNYNVLRIMSGHAGLVFQN